MITINEKALNSGGNMETTKVNVTAEKRGGDFPLIIGRDPAKIAKYLYVYILIILCGSVLFLFNKYMELDKYVRDTQHKQNTEQQVVISENTKAIEYNTKTMERITYLLDSKQALFLSTEKPTLKLR